MAIEIVDFPMKNGGSFHSFLYVYQRVYMNKTFVAGPFFTIRMYIPKLSKFDSDTIG